MFATDSYLYVVAITYRYWKKYDKTNCLQLLIFSHLFHFLYIANNKNMSYFEICDNLNLIRIGFQIYYKLSIKAEISITISVLWKSIHKNVFIEE